MNHHKNAVAYYRISTDQQGKSGLGLESQQNFVRGYAASKNLHLVHQFTEVESERINPAHYSKDGSLSV